jgi:hypothetical protein
VVENGVKLMITPTQGGPKKCFFSSTLSFDLRILRNDQRGTIAIMTALCATALVGFAALAIDVASWQVAKQSMQGAADAAAFSAGIANNKNDGTSYVTQAKGITAAQGYVDGQNGVTVTVNQPPASGSHTGSATAIEVVIGQPRPRFLSGLFLSSNPMVSARAVATMTRPPCIIALHTSANQAINVSGSAAIDATCDVASNSNSASAVSMGASSTLKTPCLRAVGTVSVTSGLTLTQCTSPTIHAAATPDPYASVPEPTGSGSCLSPVTSGSNLTFSPGKYCSGISMSGNSVATFQPGVYYVNGSFSMSGNATATGTGVTFYSMGGNVTMSGNSSMTITAPTSGTYAGIAFFGDRPDMNNTNTFSGNSATTITGAIYYPTQFLTFSGASSSGTNCVQVIAAMITVVGHAYFRSDCIGSGMADLPTVRLVE